LNKIAKAKICWIPPEDGGRKKPPIGPKYSTVVQFENDSTDWLKEAWSVVIEFHETPNESLCIIANLSFLVEEAPHHFLAVGNRFKLFEGRRVVATGEVIE
jgi:hypothetical protein